MTPILVPITHDQFVADLLLVAEAIRVEAWRPSFLIGVGRGGLVPAVYLSHATGIPTLSCDLSSQVKDFSDDVLVRLADRARQGERLLFVDDINDSGRTIGILRSRLETAGACSENVRFATLIDNVVSAESIEYRGRTIDRTKDKRWFVFPWEALAPTETIVEDAVKAPERVG